MLWILKIYFDICLFRLKPQDIPYSVFLFRATLLANIVIGFGVSSILFSFQKSLLLVSLDLFLSLTFFYLLVMMFKVRDRFIQTMSALLGTDLLFNIFLIPIVLLVLDDKDNNVLGSAAILWSFVYYWRIFIVASIIKHSFNLHFGLSFIFAIGYYLLIGIVLRSI